MAVIPGGLQCLSRRCGCREVPTFYNSLILLRGARVSRVAVCPCGRGTVPGFRFLRRDYIEGDHG